MTQSYWPFKRNKPIRGGYTSTHYTAKECKFNFEMLAYLVLWSLRRKGLQGWTGRGGGGGNRRGDVIGREVIWWDGGSGWGGSMRGGGCMRGGGSMRCGRSMRRGGSKGRGGAMRWGYVWVVRRGRTVQQRGRYLSLQKNRAPNLKLSCSYILIHFHNSYSIELLEMDEN